MIEDSCTYTVHIVRSIAIDFTGKKFHHRIDACTLKIHENLFRSANQLSNDEHQMGLWNRWMNFDAPTKFTVQKYINALSCVSIYHRTAITIVGRELHFKLRTPLDLLPPIFLPLSLSPDLFQLFFSDSLQ